MTDFRLRAWPYALTAAVPSGNDADAPCRSGSVSPDSLVHPCGLSYVIFVSHYATGSQDSVFAFINFYGVVTAMSQHLRYHKRILSHICHNVNSFRKIKRKYLLLFLLRCDKFVMNLISPVRFTVQESFILKLLRNDSFVKRMEWGEIPREQVTVKLPKRFYKSEALYT